MKKRFINIGIIAAVVLILTTVVLWNACYFEIKSIKNIEYVYRYDKTQYEGCITNQKEIDELKKIIKGIRYHGNPSCGFSRDISIKVLTNTTTLTICPALDTCPILYVLERDMYIKITDENKYRLYSILEKYGFRFPSI